MTVSPLIIVRFEKFKNWHAQDSEPVQWGVEMMSRAMAYPRWRHVRDDVTKDVTRLSLLLQSLSLILVAKQLLGVYLKNRMVDFAHFRHSNRQRGRDFTKLKALPSEHYRSFKAVFPDFHGNRLGFLKSVFATTFWDPLRVDMPNFIRIGLEMAEELNGKVSNILPIVNWKNLSVMKGFSWPSPLLSR